VAARAAGVGKLERRAREKRLARKTRGNRFRRFDEPLRVRMRRQECSDHFRMPGTGGEHSAQELQEFLARANGKTVKGMPDDVRVQMLVQVEADADAAGARVRGVVVRDGGQAGRVRVADGHGRGRPVCVRRARETGGFRRRREDAGAHEALCVGGPEAGVDTLQLVEGIEQLLGECGIGNFAGGHPILAAGVR